MFIALLSPRQLLTASKKITYTFMGALESGPSHDLRIYVSLERLFRSEDLEHWMFLLVRQ